MNNIKAVFTFFSGDKKTYNNIISFNLFSSLDSPVVSCSISVLVSSFPHAIKNTTLFYDNKIIFSGVCDFQSCTTDKNGTLLTVEARNKASILLDNEALPGTLWGASLSTIFLRHVEKYGFVLENQFTSMTLPVFTIYKGMSQWDSFALFCKSLHSSTPFVVDDTVYCKNITATKSSFIFSNTSKGEAFTSLTHTISPYEIISKIYLRDVQGQYSSSVTNTGASYFNVKRERYLLPPSDIIQSSATNADANQKIRRSMLNMESWDLEVPRLIFPILSHTVDIADTQLTKKGLIITEMNHNLNENGGSTTLKLKDSTYIGGVN